MVEALTSGHAQDGTLEFLGGCALFVIVLAFIAVLLWAISAVMPRLIRAWQWLMSAPDAPGLRCECSNPSIPPVFGQSGEAYCSNCGCRMSRQGDLIL